MLSEHEDFKPTTLGKHSTGNSREAFAESYTQFILDPDFLRVENPMAYNWVVSALKAVAR